jgi:hypothetical protein
MKIFVSTPFNLGVAFAHYGRSREYFLVQVYKNEVRNKGRNYEAQNEILMGLASRLEIDFKTVGVENASKILRDEVEDIVLDYRVGEILPLVGPNSELFTRLTLIVNGADFWQGFAPFLEIFKGRRRAKEFYLWRKVVRSYGQSKFLFPGASVNLTNQQIVAVPKDALRESLYGIVLELCLEYFPSLRSHTDDRIFIINPEVSFLNPNHIKATVNTLLKLITPDTKLVNVIIKCHPSTINSELYMDAYREELSSALTRCKIDLLDLSREGDSKMMSAFPLEFLLLALKNSVFIGFPSTAISVLSEDRFYLVMSGNKKIDSTWNRTGREFRGSI